MNDYSGLFQQIESILEESNGTLTNIDGIFTAISNILSVLLMGAYAGLWILAAIVALIIGIIYFIIESIPVYTLAKRVGYKHAWLAWMPFFHDYCRIFVLCETAGNKPFVPNLGKFKIENRKMSFLVHVLIKYFGGMVVGTVVSIVSLILPGVGSLSAILGLLPSVACALIEYVYLRDLLNIYKEDEKANNTAAIVVSVIDFILLGDFIRTCYLYTLIKKQPLPEKEIVIEASEESEIVTATNDKTVEN